jgi:hypothetical protein
VTTLEKQDQITNNFALGLDTDCLLQSISSVLHNKEWTREKELYTAQEGSDGLPEFHGKKLLGVECFGAGNTLCQTCREDRAVETNNPVSELIPRTNTHGEGKEQRERNKNFAAGSAHPRDERRGCSLQDFTEAAHQKEWSSSSREQAKTQGRGCTAEHLKQPADTRGTKEEEQAPGKIR